MIKRVEQLRQLRLPLDRDGQRLYHGVNLHTQKLQALGRSLHLGRGKGEAELCDDRCRRVRAGPGRWSMRARQNYM